ncbi:hypothetical protein STENM36S_02313 [Streptomyces tendae]
MSSPDSSAPPPSQTPVPSPSAPSVPSPGPPVSGASPRRAPHPPAYASVCPAVSAPAADNRAHTVLVPGRYVMPQASASAATSRRPRPYSVGSCGISGSVLLGARDGCWSVASTTRVPVASIRRPTSTSVPACTTALVTSSLTTTRASAARCSVSCSVPGRPSADQSASAARAIVRAAPGARELPSRVTRARAHSSKPSADASTACAGAALAREADSRCVGMAPMDVSPGSSCEFLAVDADRVTDRPRP